MPTSYTGTTSTGSASLGGTAGGAGLVQKAYDRLVEFALRAEPLIRSVADKRPTNQSTPGSTVVLQKYNDLSQATTALTETADPDAVSLTTPNTVTITLNEYGNSVLVTRALELFSLADVDPAVANIIAFNLADSIDTVAMATLGGGTNVIYSGSTATSSATISAAATLTSANVRKAVAKLRANKAAYRKGAMYWAGIHPEVSHDLRAETGAAAWRDPHNYQSNENIWAGEIGSYEGAYFIESPRIFSDKIGADQSALATTTATVAGVSAAFTFGVASSSVIANRAEVGDKISGTGVGSSAKITGIATSGSTTTFTVDVANSAAVTVGATITVTPVTRVYDTILAGQQAMAEAVAEEPHVVIGPVVDKLMRFRPMGWYGVLGFARYREEALYRIESGSSIGAL
jgi:N4-gp56 family major capsid protein